MLHRCQTQASLKGKTHSLLEEKSVGPMNFLSLNSTLLKSQWSPKASWWKVIACLNFSLNNLPAVESSLLDWDSAMQQLRDLIVWRGIRLATSFLKEPHKTMENVSVPLIGQRSRSSVVSGCGSWECFPIFRNLFPLPAILLRWTVWNPCHDVY